VVRILISIHPFKHSKSTSNGAIVLPMAWKRMLDRFSSLIDAEALFVNAGFDHKYFTESLSPYNTFFLDPRETGVADPFDTHHCYWMLHYYHDKYDFVIRIDPDAFPEVEHLQNIIQFLKDNPTTDFISASNLPRSIYHDRSNLKYADWSHVPEREKPTWHWPPWGYPTQNGDMFVIRTEFFRQCMNMYINNPITNREMSRSGVPPFGSNALRYSQICQILGKEMQYPEAYDTEIRIDGGINTDFWTFMCANNMIMSGVTDKYGRSFGNRSHMTNFPRAMAHPSWDEVQDEHDLSFKHAKNVVAPYFHTGHGYLVSWFFDSSKYSEGHAPFTSELTSGSLAFNAAHLSIIWFLTQMNRDQELIKSLDDRVSAVFAGDSQKKRNFEEFREKIINFYRPALEDYE
jgi:hypothetical protein